MTVEAIIDWAGSTSGFVNARRSEQERVVREIRELAEGYGGEVSIATEVFVGQLTRGSSGMRETSS